MNTLYVVDVSALVYTGEFVNNFKERSYYNYPVGGIHFLMRYVSVAFAARDDVILCFDSPCFRKELFKDYKAGREKNQRVISQIESVYEGLLSCGFDCAKVSGYEADDIVHWATDEFVSKYSEIVIVGNDHDLCHDVRPKVRFKPIRSDMNGIYVGNFETSIERGKRIVFNTISAYKVFCGCSSDRIPVFKSSHGGSGEVLYREFITFIQDNKIPVTYANTTNPALLRVFVKYCPDFSDADREELEKRIQLVYPAERPDSVTLTPIRFRDINKDLFYKFLTFYNDRDSLKCVGGRSAFLSEDDKQNLRDKARSLTSGEYAADHDIVSAAKVRTSSLQLDSFTKDF